MENKKITIKDVFVISDTADKESPNRWIKVGVAFLNKDDSLNLVLDALPINGKLHIRDRKIKE
ncbi:MAG: hypothetical protein ACD_73C00272G0001 [uncultured bacterium]|nr:MAG: hypothetical protein ACD_73C00272G0001 [uncultured bacterium]